MIHDAKGFDVMSASLSFESRGRSRAETRGRPSVQGEYDEDDEASRPHPLQHTPTHLTRL